VGYGWTKRPGFGSPCRSRKKVAVRDAWLLDVIGHEVNIKSPKQMAEFFYQEMGQKEIKKRNAEGGYSVTANDEAMHKIAEREPILQPITRKIAELRSLGVFHSTFVQAPLDIDGRLRCSFNICGTETYRFASSKNAFDSRHQLPKHPQGGRDRRRRPRPSEHQGTLYP